MKKINLEICICTYKRKSYLEDLIKSIIDALKPDDTNIGLIIIDNDPEQSAKEVVELYSKKDKKVSIKYFHEQKRGISYARNTSIKKALENNCDVIAFLDDDETVDENWIVNIMKHHVEHPEHIIIGSVKPIFEEDTDEWIKNSHYFDKPKAPLTANALFKINKLADMTLPLDPKYALTGGSDTHLKIRLKELGHKFLYVDDVCVLEKIPLSRANYKWVLNRAFRTGYTAALIETELYGKKGLAKRIFVITSRIAMTIPLLVVSIFKGKIGFTNLAANTYKIFGNVYGLTNGEYYEYKKTHGK